MEPLYNGHRVSLPGGGVDHPLPSSVEVKESTVILLLPLWAFMVGYGVNISFNLGLGSFFIQTMVCCKQGNTFSCLMNLENFSGTEELLESRARICSVELVVHKRKSASNILVSICVWHEEYWLVERNEDYAGHNTVVRKWKIRSCLCSASSLILVAMNK